MSRMLFVIISMSVGITGCQNAKFGGKKSAPAAAQAAPGPQRPPPPIYNPPPQLTDDTGGMVHQPNQPPPPIYVPPGNPPPRNPPPQNPPPIYIPPNNPPQQPPLPPPIDVPPPQQPPLPPPPVSPPPPITQEPPPPIHVQPPAQPPAIPLPPPPVTTAPPPVTQEPPPSPLIPGAPAQPPAPFIPPPVTTVLPPTNWTEPPAVPPGQPPAQPPPVALPPQKVEPPTIVDWNEPQPLPVDPRPCNDPVKGCGTQVVQPEPPPPQEDCRNATNCTPPDPIRGKCTAELRVDKKRNKLDILFVVDTSASLRRGGVRSIEDGELVQIARGMKEFVKNLDPDTDYRIAVMTGHGPASRFHGKLIGGDEGAVLDYKSLAREGMSRAQIERELARILERKMKNIPNESGGAQGEAMMLALYDSITKPGLLSAIKAQGFYRADAALNVIIVTDEQDVCFKYEGTQFQPTLKTISRGGRTEQIADPYETSFFQEVCTKAAGSVSIQVFDVE